MTNAEYLRKLRSEAKVNGLCGTCRCRPAAPERVSCSFCLATQQTRHRVRKERNPTVGRCVYCERPCATGRSSCHFHLEYERRRLKLRKAEWRAAGRCGSCGADRDEQSIAEGRKICATCRIRSRGYEAKHRDRRRASGRGYGSISVRAPVRVMLADAARAAGKSAVAFTDELVARMLDDAGVPR